MKESTSGEKHKVKNEMKTTSRGNGEPEIAVVYCTHGNETAGKQAAEKILEEEPEFLKPVKFVFANEEAFEEGERYIDCDLNRSFPGNPDSDKYEERLAAEMMEELRELKVLDLHESSTSPVPFSLFTWMDEKTLETLQSTGTEKAVEISYTPGCGINHYGGVEVETGPRGTEKSVQMAYRILKQFLVNEGALPGEKELSESEIYSVYGTRSRGSGQIEVKAENFTEVQAGEVIAEGDSEVRADEGFVPVLFDESYDEILGFKAVRLEKVEERIFEQEDDQK